MKKLAIDIALRLTFSKWIRQAFPISIAFIYCCKIVLMFYNGQQYETCEI